MAAVQLKGLQAGELESRLDFAIADREFVTIISPRQRETSAIVRAIAGLSDVTAGELLFDDRPVAKVAAKDRDVALLAHDYQPYPGLSVRENLALGLKGRQFGAAEIEKRIAAVAEALDLQRSLDTPADSLAPVDRRFVGLARVMVRQPRIYLFDSPFANLGPVEASRGRAAVAALQLRSPATIIYCTEDPAEALAIGARTIVVVDGAIQQDADAQTVYDAPANLSVAKFFGQPPMNLIGGTVKSEREGVAFTEAGDGTIAVALPTPRFDAARGWAGKTVVLGVRPEDVAIANGPETGNHARNTFRALIERAETRGAYTDLYLQTGAHNIVSRSAIGQSEGAGRRSMFMINLEKAHLFDSETGLPLGPNG